MGAGTNTSADHTGQSTEQAEEFSDPNNNAINI